MRARVNNKARNTALFAGIETTTAAYLNGLSSPLVVEVPLHRSATEAYLASLSQLAEQTTATQSSPEDYLTSVSQLAGSTTQYLADGAALQLGEGAAATTTTEYASPQESIMMERVEAWVEDNLVSSTPQVSAPEMMMDSSTRLVLPSPAARPCRSRQHQAKP